jgi:hypothetical protein
MRKRLDEETVITNCDDCPHFAETADNPVKYVCNALWPDPGRIIPDDCEFPDFCSLPDEREADNG